MTCSVIEDNIEVVNNLPEPQQKRVMVDYFSSHGFTMPFRHTHLQYEILYIKKGNAIVENNGTRTEVSAPCIVVHKPFTLHRVIVQGTEVYERYVTNFDESLLTSFSTWIPDLVKMTESASTVIALDSQISDRITDIFNEMRTCSEEGIDGRCELLLAYLINIVTSYSGSGVEFTKQVECAYVASAMDYIASHFGENILIEELSKKLFVSRAKFISDFKSYTGITVKQYIQLTRINYAKLMLVSGSSITETAQRCGFCDDSHFVYTFRKLVGMTPRAYSLNPALADTGV